ncbi:MAG: hypothetical protein OHK0048_23780 [Rhodoferax sp.]
MHLIIAHAALDDPQAHSALDSAALPHLRALLAGVQAQQLHRGEATDFTPPHERALAQALGLPDMDGQIPWAAWHAHQRGLTLPAGQGWAFVSLCRWQVNTQHMILSHLPVPHLDATESDTLLAALRPYFAEDGIDVLPDQPGRWLACGAALTEVATAAPDRVLGRELQHWLPRGPRGSVLRRWMNEMQMLLYTHPVYDARQARGQIAPNSLWFHGSGVLPQPPALRPDVVLDTSLREAAVRADTREWLRAWQALDTLVLAPLRSAPGPVQLSLCGEAGWRTLRIQTPGAWQKIKQIFGRQRLSELLKAL